MRNDNGTAERLYGSWRLKSLKFRYVGDEAPPQDLFGPEPFGRLILTSEHTMAAFLSKGDRSPPSNAAEAAALMSSMIAYTGRYRLEGDRWITTVDGAWDETFRMAEQVRYFHLEGDALGITTPEQPSVAQPGKQAVVTLVWEREQ